MARREAPTRAPEHPSQNLPISPTSRTPPVDPSRIRNPILEHPTNSQKASTARNGNGRTGQEVSGPASGGWLDCASFQSRSRLGQIRFRFCSGLSRNRSAKSFWGWGSGTPLKIKTYRGARSGFLSSHRAPGEGKPRVYSSHYPIRVAGKRFG